MTTALIDQHTKQNKMHYYFRLSPVHNCVNDEFGPVRVSSGARLASGTVFACKAALASVSTSASDSSTPARRLPAEHNFPPHKRRTRTELAHNPKQSGIASEEVGVCVPMQTRRMRRLGLPRGGSGSGAADVPMPLEAAACAESAASSPSTGSLGGSASAEAVIVVGRGSKPSAGFEVVDVTSRGAAPFNLLSPFFCPPTAIPVPFLEGSVTSTSVEGVWQGLKIFAEPELDDDDARKCHDGKQRGVDASKFGIRNQKGIKRTCRSLGRVLGHYAGEDQPLLGIADARRAIFLPSYAAHLSQHEKLVGKLRKRVKTGGRLALRDFFTNNDVEVDSPLSHAALLRSWILHGDFSAVQNAGSKPALAQVEAAEPDSSAPAPAPAAQDEAGASAPAKNVLDGASLAIPAVKKATTVE